MVNLLLSHISRLYFMNFVVWKIIQIIQHSATFVIKIYWIKFHDVSTYQNLETNKNQPSLGLKQQASYCACRVWNSLSFQPHRREAETFVFAFRISISSFLLLRRRPTDHSFYHPDRQRLVGRLVHASCRPASPCAPLLYL